MQLGLCKGGASSRRGPTLALSSWRSLLQARCGVPANQPLLFATLTPCPSAQLPPQVVELLMLRSGCDVCCTTDADRSAISRYEAQLEAEASRAEAQ